MSKPERAKLLIGPDDQVGEFSLPGDFDGVLETIRYIMRSGTDPKSRPYLVIWQHIIPDEGEPVDEYYTAGTGFIPCEEDEGRSAVAVDAEAASRGMSKTSNTALLFREYKNAGFPADKLNGASDVTVVEKTRAHWIRVNQPARDGLDQQRAVKGGQSVRPPRPLLVPGRVLQLPWEKSGSKATKARATSASSSIENGAVRDETKALLKDLLAKNGGTLDRSRLPILAFKAVPKSNSGKNAIVDLISTEELLALQDGWLFDVATGEVVLV